MKRILLIALALGVLIAGCANTDPSETTEEPAQTQPDSGIYIPDSPLEQQTGGAVRVYEPEQDGYYGLASVADRILLLSGKENTRLQLLSGEMCALSNSAELPVDLITCGQVIDNGIAYYDAQNNEAVFLDSQLAEIKRMALPQGIQGVPVFAPNGTEIFYCVGQEIRGMDTQQGLSRLIKSHSCESQTLQGIYFDGKVLQCSLTDSMWKQRTLYISTENGANLGEDKHIAYLSTFEDRYVLERMDGTVRQWICGTLDGTRSALNVQADMVVGATQLDGAVGVTTDSAGTRLSFYELTSGKMTAAVTLTGFAKPAAVLADRWSGCVWILAAEGDKQALLRWNVKESAVTEETVYTGPVFTSQSPDEAGLDGLQDRVDALNRQHITAIRIWNAAVKTNGGYTLEPEHQPQAIAKTLDELEQVLNVFPEGFLGKSVNTKIRICIVHSANGSTEAVRFWNDGDPFVILPCGVDVKTEFMKAMGYIVDSHTLGNSPLLDQWQGLNPESFTYGTKPSQELLEGDTRAFADEASMSAVTEDRARIFYEAMQPDNGAMFASEIMQSKLLLLCQGIRDAWRWERKTETYPWEQYLNQSIAYIR